MYTKFTKFSKAIFSIVYNISQPNFAILLKFGMLFQTVIVFFSYFNFFKISSERLRNLVKISGGESTQPFLPQEFQCHSIKFGKKYQGIFMFQIKKTSRNKVALFYIIYKDR